MRLDLLHGFLGLPSDWSAQGVVGTCSWNLWGKAQTPLKDLKKAFATEVASRGEVAIGYGMGGRLILELLRQGAIWERVVLISVHPGLKEIAARRSRQLADERWAHRFEHEPWDLLMKDWNAQPVFQNTALLDRQEKDFDRGSLSAVLRNWSLRHMEPWTPQSQDPKIEWIYGENDASARPHVQKLKDLGANVTVVPNAGHRVGWDAWKNKAGHPFEMFPYSKTFALNRPKTESQKSPSTAPISGTPSLL